MQGKRWSALNVLPHLMPIQSCGTPLMRGIGSSAHRLLGEFNQLPTASIARRIRPFAPSDPSIAVDVHARRVPASTTAGFRGEDWFPEFTIRVFYTICYGYALISCNLWTRYTICCCTVNCTFYQRMTEFARLIGTIGTRLAEAGTTVQIVVLATCRPSIRRSPYIFYRGSRRAQRSASPA